MDYTIKIGGEAGQGVQTVGELLADVFARMGYHVFTNQDYESRVRGGHNFYQIRVAVEPITAAIESADIVVALDRASIEQHRGELREGGVLVMDAEALGEKPEGDEVLDVPFRKLAVEEGGGAVMANVVATGAVLGMLGMPTAAMEDLLRARFGKKGEAVVEGNLKSLRAGHAYAKENCRQCRFLPGEAPGGPKVLVTGLEAAALGALASGVKFYSAYPMTPSTGVMNHIAERAREFGVVVEQAEDEIAAINMAIGASFAGVRAATGSSGGGFALMVEGLSLAAMTETPLVIFEVQRPGPATGFPTRTEQGDLLFVLFSGHGEFPRAVFAPGSPEECVTLTNKAFDLAEKYQVPAFVVFDQYLGDAQWTYDALEPELVYKDYRLRGEALRALPSYNRYALTAGGVNPLAVPGESQHLVVADSDEHDEAGHMVEDAPTRIAMTKKRLHAKLGPLSAEIAPPILEGGDGGERPEIVLVGWGSSYGVLRETVAAMRARGRAAAMLFFSELWPFPVGDYLEILVEAPTVVCVEGNATGQFAKLFRMETGYHFRRQVLRYDGRPLTAEYILRELHDV